MRLRSFSPNNHGQDENAKKILPNLFQVHHQHDNRNLRFTGLCQLGHNRPIEYRRFALPNVPSTAILSNSSWRASFFRSRLSTGSLGGRPSGGPDNLIPRSVHQVRLSLVPVNLISVY
jgi:hypothetical protein